MSNHSASYMLNDILHELVDKKYLDRFTKEERDDILSILTRELDRKDGNFPEMVVGLEDYFGVCRCCRAKTNPKDLESGLCPKCDE